MAGVRDRGHGGPGGVRAGICLLKWYYSTPKIFKTGNLYIYGATVGDYQCTALRIRLYKSNWYIDRLLFANHGHTCDPSLHPHTRNSFLRLIIVSIPRQ